MLTARRARAFGEAGSGPPCRRCAPIAARLPCECATARICAPLLTTPTRPVCTPACLRASPDWPVFAMMDKTFDPAAVEARIADAGRRPRRSGPAGRGPQGASPTRIVIPPPNVTGSLHMGHALNNTLQDILCRFERMRGKDVLWQPGTDHAGIATQMVVERQLMERQEPAAATSAARNSCERVWEWKAESGGTHRQPAEAPRRLLRLVARALHHGRGPVARRPEGVRRPAQAGPDLQGQAPRELGPEVPDRDLRPGGGAGRGRRATSGTSATADRRASRDRASITVATTRPETMLGDIGVAVHPDDERYKRPGRPERDPAAGRPPHPDRRATSTPTRRRAPAR